MAATGGDSVALYLIEVRDVDGVEGHLGTRHGRLNILLRLLQLAHGTGVQGYAGTAGAELNGGGQTEPTAATSDEHVLALHIESGGDASIPQGAQGDRRGRDRQILVAAE